MPAQTPPERLVDEGQLTITSKLDLLEIKLKARHWLVKLAVDNILPRSYYKYRITLDVDETPYIERIEDIEQALKDSLFAADKVSKKEADKKITEIRNQLDDLKKQCERIEFLATVEELKYKDGDTILVVRVPDDVIEPFNRQKSRFDYYCISLEPLYA